MWTQHTFTSHAHTLNSSPLALVPAVLPSPMSLCRLQGILVVRAHFHLADLAGPELLHLKMDRGTNVSPRPPQHLGGRVECHSVV